MANELQETPNYGFKRMVKGLLKPWEIYNALVDKLDTLSLGGNGATIPSPSPAFVVLTDAPTVTWNIAQKPVSNATLTLGGNRTLSLTNRANGSQGMLTLIQDATGGRTLTLPAGSIQNGGGGTVAKISTTANAKTILVWIYDGTNTWWSIGKDFA